MALSLDEVSGLLSFGEGDEAERARKHGKTLAEIARQTTPESLPECDRVALLLHEGTFEQREAAQGLRPGGLASRAAAAAAAAARAAAAAAEGTLPATATPPSCVPSRA
ncbi:hypothetical protein FNF31_02859 [Cafeteria roenbergensis]|uniref:Uncharacterized protein n=1 Tax=Cafeteria roenbergensis TaxID=33653 RepID=A0A5A8DDQ6_CAFRO|nr:hypothetical protein FNF31_02859 [Cafeteria roenbergensis]KAA0165944.1 hypothetical protein FNF28_03326 [Cafeteria roenbergensis]